MRVMFTNLANYGAPPCGCCSHLFPFFTRTKFEKKTEKKTSSDVDEVQVSEAPGYLEKISPQVAMQQEPIDWSYQSHI